MTTYLVFIEKSIFHIFCHMPLLLQMSLLVILVKVSELSGNCIKLLSYLTLTSYQDKSDGFFYVLQTQTSTEASGGNDQIQRVRNLLHPSMKTVQEAHTRGVHHNGSYYQPCHFSIYFYI